MTLPQTYYKDIISNSLSLQRQVSWKTKTIPDLYFILLFFLTSSSTAICLTQLYWKCSCKGCPWTPGHLVAQLNSVVTVGVGKRRAQQRRGLWWWKRVDGGLVGKNKFNGYTSPFLFPKLCGALDLTPVLASMIPLRPCFPRYLPGSSVVLSFSLFLKSWCSRGLNSIPVNLYSF